MKLSSTLTMLLISGALASAACIVEEVDTNNTGGGGSDPTGTGGDASGGGNVGGDASGGGNVGGAGGSGGMAQGGGGEGGGGTEACLDACDAMYPNGVDDYLDYLSCAYCAACYDICDGGTGDVCASGEQVGTCSAEASSCDECANSLCTADEVNGEYTGVCATEYQGFVENPDALSLNNCYGACQE